MSALQRAIDEVGGVAKLARIIGVTTQAISQWEEVPPKRVLAVERATGGKITRHELRPDFYPNPQDGIPADERNQEAA